MDHIQARQAYLMRSTMRVGDEREDASMKRARFALSAINTLGLITVDSQMGMKHKNHWQRAYVWGLATRATASKLTAALITVDSVLVLTFPHGESAPNALAEYALSHMPRLALTLQGPGLRDAVTRHPLGASATFSEMWAGLLPELHAEMARDMTPGKLQHVKAQCQRASLQIFIVDTMWGRPTWLFKTIIHRMQAANSSVGKI